MFFTVPSLRGKELWILKKVFILIQNLAR
jgi:hypothetical protein